MNIAIYTAIFKNYDKLNKLPLIDADKFCFTDNKNIIQDSWNTLQINARNDLNPIKRNRWFKLFPYKINDLKDYDITIYIDGNCSIISNNFIDYCIKNLKSDILIYKHNLRNCIYKEIVECKRCRKFKENYRTQLNDYRKIYPINNGLYWCGCLIRRNSKVNEKISELWWEHLNKYTFRDQVSFPVVLYKLGIHPSIFPEKIENHIIIKKHA